HHPFHSNAMAGDHPATEPMSKAEAAKWHGGGHGGKIPCVESLVAYPPSSQLTHRQIAIQNTSGRHRVVGTRSRRTGRRTRPSWERSCWALAPSYSRSAATWRSEIGCQSRADSIQADSTWSLSMMLLDANTSIAGQNK